MPKPMTPISLQLAGWTTCTAVEGYLAVRRTGVPRRETRTGNARFWEQEIKTIRGLGVSNAEIESAGGRAPRLRINGEAWAISYATTDGWRACLIGPAGPLGLDAEYVRDYADLNEMCRRAGPSTALSRAGDSLGWCRAGQFARLWAAKEAVLKAAGTGLSIDPQRVRLHDVHPGGCRCTLSVTRGGPRRAVADTATAASIWDVLWITAESLIVAIAHEAH
jgi:phosphopantetheinyl transferase